MKKKTQRSFYPKKGSLESQWVIYDAKHKVLGRAASDISSLVMGKYSATFTPSSDGLTLVEVSAGKFTDSTGNSNSAASPFSWTYDSTSPTISISSADVTSGSTTNDNSITLAFTLSEPSANFHFSDT